MIRLVRGRAIYLALAAMTAMTATAGTARTDAPVLSPSRLSHDWFYGQRAYPHASVPAGARLEALRQLDTMTSQEAATGRLATTPRWTLIGPRPVHTPYGASVLSGRLTAIVVDPSVPTTAYAGTAEGGVWKTTNGGTNWAPLTDRQPSLAVGSLALDPTNSNTIYVGTGEENFGGDSYYGAGLLKSTDAGATWTHVCGPFCGPLAKDSYYGGGARIGVLAVSPANNQVVLAAVALNFKDGIYRSTDGGITWTTTPVLAGNPGTAVLFDPARPGVAYAALGNIFSGGTAGVYRSTDYGQTWTAINGSGTTALPIGSAARITLAMDPVNTLTLYASVADINTESLDGLYRSTDGGSTWARLPSVPDFCTPQCSYDNAVAVDPANPNVIYAGGAFRTTLVRSLDGGATWSILQSAQANGRMHADVHAITFAADGSVLYVGNDGGAYSTQEITAANPKLAELNSTLAITQFYGGFSVGPGTSALALGGTQDNGTDLYAGTKVWNDVVCGDGGAAAIDPSAPATMYATCQQIDIMKSTSSGAAGTWFSVNTGINTADRVEFIPPLAIDQSHPDDLYFGTDRLYQTLNGAGTWTAISGDLTAGPSFWGVITAMAVAPSNSNTVYVGTGDSRLWVTTNALSGTSATFARIDNASLPTRVLTDIAVDPANPGTAYATFSGFKGFGDNLGHVFRMTDFGVHWTDISGRLPNSPVNSIAVDPVNSSELFIGTDIGVFYTTNGGTTWATLNQGLPRVVVDAVTIQAASGLMIAATHGRSAWSINVTSLPPT